MSNVLPRSERDKLTLDELIHQLNDLKAKGTPGDTKVIWEDDEQIAGVGQADFMGGDVVLSEDGYSIVRSYSS